MPSDSPLVQIDLSPEYKQNYRLNPQYLIALQSLTVD